MKLKKNTRLMKRKFKKIHARKKRFEKSSIPFLTDLLSDEWKKCEVMPNEWRSIEELEEK